MKLPVNSTIKDIFGKDIVPPPSADDPNPAPMTLATVIQNSLLNALKGDENMDGASKLALHTLAVRTLDPDSDYLIDEDVSLIKRRIGMAYGPVIVGPAYALIEGGTK